VVVGDFDFVGITILPPETDPKLRHTQLSKIPDAVELCQLAMDDRVPEYGAAQLRSGGREGTTNRSGRDN